MVTTLAELLEERAAWKSAGQAVVFTNGCFDLLHPGHVALFEAARAQGSVLVVGLNSDRSVRALKGEGRPLIPEAERAETLAVRATADALGNTPAVARSSYIDPAVFTAYERGRLLALNVSPESAIQKLLVG